jgi:hypothetical protein
VSTVVVVSVLVLADGFSQARSFSMKSKGVPVQQIAGVEGAGMGSAQR